MAFDPELHLRDIKGATYLDVKWRVKWFREDYPHGTIMSEELVVDLDNGYARFRATVTDGEGGMATATATQWRKNMKVPGMQDDFVETCETASIGRALALLGYGTQFVGDEDGEAEHVVDSPVEPKAKAVKTTKAREDVTFLLGEILETITQAFPVKSQVSERMELIEAAFGVAGWGRVKLLEAPQLQAGYAHLKELVSPPETDPEEDVPDFTAASDPTDSPQTSQEVKSDGQPQALVTRGVSDTSPTSTEDPRDTNSKDRSQPQNTPKTHEVAPGTTFANAPFSPDLEQGDQSTEGKSRVSLLRSASDGAGSRDTSGDHEANRALRRNEGDDKTENSHRPLLQGVQQPSQRLVSGGARRAENRVETPTAPQVSEISEHANMVRERTAADKPEPTGIRDDGHQDQGEDTGKTQVVTEFLGGDPDLGVHASTVQLDTLKDLAYRVGADAVEEVNALIKNHGGLVRMKVYEGVNTKLRDRQAVKVKAALAEKTQDTIPHARGRR